MSAVQTFWCERTEKARVVLRRYRSSSDPCGDKSMGYCNGETLLHAEASREEWPTTGDYPDRFTHEDARWPTKCDACGREFTDADAYQVFVRDLYSGALDGIVLVVKLPNGLEWIPDGPAANSKNLPGWKRTGDPRKANLTATPSIGSPWPPSSPRYYHGWLRDGRLVEV